MLRPLADEAVPEQVGLSSRESVLSTRQTSDEYAGGAAVTLLTVYVAILWGVPAAQTIGVLGSMGTPSLLWGFVCLAYWGWTRLRYLRGPTRPLQPVRIAYLAFFVVVWISFALAHARGLPGDEVSPSTTGLLRTLSWAGVVLLANDGLRNKEQLLSLARRITLFGGLMALLGLAQFATGQSFIDRIQLPGFTVNQDLLGVLDRSGFVRANATATHPLEFAVVLAGVLPLSIGLAWAGVRRGLLRAWWIPAATGLICLLSSSRSAIIGFVVGVVGMLPILSGRGRLLVVGAIGLGLAFVYVTVPGMLGFLSSLFMSPDSSTTSRTNGLGVTAQVWAEHPFLGRSFGTFLPKYYILDNQLALLVIEIGLLGLFAFLMLVAAAMIQTQRARRIAANLELAVLAHSLTTAVAACVVLFAFFDAFSFGMAAGTLALLLGMSGAVFNVATSDPRAAPQSRMGGEDWTPQAAPGSVRGQVHSTLSAPRRSGPLVLAVVLGTLATLGCWFHILMTPPVYWTRVEVVIANNDVTTSQAILLPPDGNLVPFAVAVEQVVNNGRPVTRLNSREASLYGLGARESRSVYVLNEGNQWAPQFPLPIIVVETVSGTREGALAARSRAQADIGSAVTNLQGGWGIPEALRVHPVSVLSEPAVVPVGSSRRGQLMALFSSGLAGALATTGVVVLLARRQVGLRARTPTTFP